ncbi:MAG: hypothetical protein U5Q16_02060 [Gammaproteobacteria bacterium]|nr:hypothetical protein [Gammaproteobacteria bacterium]
MSDSRVIDRTVQAFAECRFAAAQLGTVDNFPGNSQRPRLRPLGRVTRQAQV